jgi:hypothetical protein
VPPLLSWRHAEAPGKGDGQAAPTLGEKKANVKFLFSHLLTRFRSQTEDGAPTLSTVPCCSYYSLFAGLRHDEDMPDPLPRSAGVTAAATYAILCCVTALFFWGYVFVFLVNASADDQGRHIYQNYPVIFWVIALAPPALIALGVRTAVGLLHLRPWARLTSMLWATVALALCAAIIAFRPFETFIIPQRFVNHVVLLKQLISVSFVVLLLPISVWWLFYFRTRGVKLQFVSSANAHAGLPTPEKI